MSVRVINLSPLPLRAEVVRGDTVVQAFDLDPDGYCVLNVMTSDAVLELKNPELDVQDIAVLLLNDQPRTAVIDPGSGRRRLLLAPGKSRRLHAGAGEEDEGGAWPLALRPADRTQHLQATGRLWHVHGYLENRACGGPEEGGWYYDTGEFTDCHGAFETRSEAESVLAALQPALEEDRQGRYPPSSVLCGGWPVLKIETRQGKSYPERRPTYA